MNNLEAVGMAKDVGVSVTQYGSMLCDVTGTGEGSSQDIPLEESPRVRVASLAVPVSRWWEMLSALRERSGLVLWAHSGSLRSQPLVTSGLRARERGTNKGESRYPVGGRRKAFVRECFGV